MLAFLLVLKLPNVTLVFVKVLLMSLSFVLIGVIVHYDNFYFTITGSIKKR